MSNQKDMNTLSILCSGSVVTNCAGDGSYCVGMTSGEWQQCAPAPHEQRLTLQEIGDSEAGFPAKGAPGGFCIPSTAEALTGQPRGCEAGLACIPLPVRAPVTASVSFAECHKYTEFLHWTGAEISLSAIGYHCRRRHDSTPES